MKVALLGINDKKHIKEQIKILSAAGRLSRFKGNVSEVLEICNDYDKNLNFIKRVIGMGHESITDHDYLVFSIIDVTPIIEQTIIEERLCSFTIKSRREVDFSKAGFYTPIFRDKFGKPINNQDKWKMKYRNHMKYLFKSYSKLLEKGINKEDARFILPYSYHSNIIMGVDAHILKNLIIRFTKGKESRIAELKEFGEKLLKIATKRTPYLIELIEKEIPNYEAEKFIDSKIKDKDYKIVPNVTLLSYTSNVDETIFVTYLMQHYQYDYKKALEIYHGILNENKDILEKWIKLIGESYEKEVLTAINFRFQIPLSLAVLTHLSRHRTHDIIVPDFVPIHNLMAYKTPESINKNCKNEYDQIYANNNKIYEEFKQAGIMAEDLIYFHLSGNMVNVLTNMNGKDIHWILHLRECTKAQWEIRSVAQSIHHEISKVSKYFPMILGPTCITKGFCPEGKESCGRIKNIKK